MKSIKRIFSSMLVVAMLISLISINVVAAEDFEIRFTSPQPILGGTEQMVTVDLELVKNPGLVGFKVNFSFDETNLELVSFEDKEVLKGYNGYDGEGNTDKVLTWKDTSAKKNNTATGILATLTFKVKSTTTVGEYTIGLEPVKTGMLNVNLDKLDATATNGVIKVTEKTNIKEDKAITADVAYGADLIAALPEKVTFNTVTTVSAKDDTQEFEVNWNTTGLSTAPEIDGVKKLDTTNNTITVEGNPVITGNTFDANGKKAIATVTIKPIAATAADLTAATGKVKEDTENGITEAAIKESLGNTINVSKGEGTAKIEDTFTVTWNTVDGYTGDGKGYKDKDRITVKGNLTSPSKKGLFTVDDATKAVTGTVTVGPANIEGGSFELTDSIFVPGTKPAVKVTVPAAEVAKLKLTEEDASEAARKVVASIADKSEGAAADAIAIADDAEFTDNEIRKARKDVSDAGEDAEKLAALAPYTKTVNFSKSLSDLGYDTTDAKKAFTVSVTVGGTTLLAGKNEDGTVIEKVGGTVVKPSSGGPSGNIGINKGNTTKTYAVTVVETKNGTATVSADKAAQGTTVTVKAEPAEGYKVKTVTVTKADGTNVPVDEKALTFTMPASAVKVAVEFEEGKDEPSVDPTPADGKFADVADDFWAAKDIYTLKDAGIIGGKSATEFDPEGDVTRAEFAKMVVGLFGYKATSGAVNFTDCGADDWFTEFVAAGVEAGVIKGVSDTEFAPNATITREDACTILGRALNKVAQSAELKFSDADKVAEYAAPYVALLSELGYVNGYEDGSFAPANNITRAEAAKIIAGIYNANKSAETVTDDKTETDANADAAVEEKVEEKTDEKAVDTIETEPEK